MNRLPLRLQLHATAPFLLAALEFVWRSGCCGSAVGIHHDSPCCGATLLLPPPTQPFSALPGGVSRSSRRPRLQPSVCSSAAAESQVEKK